MPDAPRRPWVALAVDGPLPALAAVLGDGRMWIEATPEAFDAAVRRLHPTIAILAAPPATLVDDQRALHLRAVHPDLRLVHLTPPAESARRMDVLRRGYDEALADTIDDDELLARLMLLEARSGTGRRTSAVAVADDVVLDPIAHEVRRGGRPLHLRPREYGLLAALAARPGRALSRQELLDEVWGHDHHGDPRTVDVHVRWLRSKIEREPSMPTHLVTVRGLGYRLDPPLEADSG